MVSVVVMVWYFTCTLQMIRKSVETRDWMNTIEPRNVRAVMKRIVEDVTAIDSQVGQLYEEGVRKAHSSGVDRTVLFPRTFLCFDQFSITWIVFCRSLKTSSHRKSCVCAEFLR